MSLSKSFGGLLLLILLGGCETLTEIVVSIDTDMKIPAELDAVGFQADYIQGPDNSTVAFKTWEVDLNRPNAIKLPTTIGLLPGESLDTPILITVSGYRLGEVKLDRKAKLTFVEGRVLLLTMFLLRCCLHKDCPEGQTCGEAGCEPVEKDSSKLPSYGPDAAFKGVGDAMTDIAVDSTVPDPDTLAPDGGGPDLPQPDTALPDLTAPD